MVSFERVFEILDLPIEIQDKPDAKVLQNIAGTVSFHNVSFSYLEGGENTAAILELVDRHHRGNIPTHSIQTPKPSRQRALNGVHFEINPGQLAALVGPSGAGKTTISYLLPRLYDPTSGKICLDGHDLRSLKQNCLANAIGMVTQQTFLFNDTLMANLLYASPDATTTRIQAACQAANIHEFISSLPDGYNTVVGERGYRLSGGEKQRIAIARVILKDPRILVLDEATSSLDSHSENLIQEALERIMEGRTSLVIAHRLSTILGADVILVLDQGCIVEQGQSSETHTAHERLIEENGLYASLYQTQFGNKNFR
jgi:ATP-binding cassette subfamily B protein